VEDAAADGLRYLELRFSPFYMAQPHGLGADTVIEAVVDGVRRGQREQGVRVNLIGILNRTYGPQSAWREMHVLLAHRSKLVALDIAGDEARYPGELFVGTFRRARAAGMRLTIHAGEAAGPASVWQAVRDLGAERIGHGVHAIEDAALLDELARRGTGIESSLTSNVQTSTVASYAAHPLRVFLERGLRATINTDDPGVSGITLSHELTVAAPAAGLSPAQVRQAQANAIAVAFLSEGEKAELRAGRAPL
jgi:adenosine deaminase